MNKLIIILVSIVFLYSCKKNAETPKPSEEDDYTKQDLGIRFTHYAEGLLYPDNDTIHNNFAIKNYGPTDLKKGDTLKAACKIGGVLWALDLIGEGPSNIILEEDLKKDEEFHFNPGYLLGSTILQYFNVDNVDLCVMVYGVNNVIVNENFPSDSKKENNIDCLNFSNEGIKLK